MKSTATEPGLSDSVNEFLTLFRNELKKNCLTFTPNPLSWTEKSFIQERYKPWTNNLCLR